MHARRFSWCIVCLAVIAVALCIAWDDQASGERYRVVGWPPATSSDPYSEIFEKFLNEMARQGWELDQSLLGPSSARMLVFRGDRSSTN